MGHDTMPVDERVEKNAKAATVSSIMKFVSKKTSRNNLTDMYKVSNNFNLRVSIRSIVLLVHSFKIIQC